MTEAAHTGEIKNEYERNLHMTRIVEYVRCGAVLPEATLDFFDHDAAILLRFLDRLGERLQREGLLEAREVDDPTTCTGRLFELRELYRPLPPH